MNRLLATTALAMLLGLGTAVAQDPAPAEPEASPPAAQPSDPASPPSAMPSDEPASPTPDQSSEAPSSSPDQSSEAPESISPAPEEGTAEAPQSISPQPSDEGAAPSASASAQFLNEQESDDWLASNLIGLSVTNAENERLGEINDLVTDENGKIVAALIGVGGFLGIGEKDVAVRFEDLKLSRDEDNAVTAMLNANQDALASAPDFETLDEKEVAVGSDSGDQEAPASQEAPSSQ